MINILVTIQRIAKAKFIPSFGGVSSPLPSERALALRVE
jgi:hypothetical protein